MIEVLSVVKPVENKLLLIGQSSDAEGLARWLGKFIIMEDAKVEPLSSAYAHYIVYDIDSVHDVTQSLTIPAGTLIWEEEWGDTPILHLSCDKLSLEQMLDQLKRLGIRIAQPDQFENFRIWKGIPKSPNELSDHYNPLEANLSSLISWTKGCYIGQEVITRLESGKDLFFNKGDSRISVRPVTQGDGQSDGRISS